MLQKSVLTLDMGLRHALSQKLQTSLSQIHHLAFVLLLKLCVRLDLAVGNAADLLDNIVRLANETNQSLVF